MLEQLVGDDCLVLSRVVLLPVGNHPSVELGGEHISNGILGEHTPGSGLKSPVIEPGGDESMGLLTEAQFKSLAHRVGFRWDRLRCLLRILLDISKGHWPHR
ncbi:MAG: hypothetical protein O2909_12690 [Chloroflexi bacterium]|nr:hypothetical protein [Chloroflexota bacterium]